MKNTFIVILFLSFFLNITCKSQEIYRDSLSIEWNTYIISTNIKEKEILFLPYCLGEDYITLEILFLKTEYNILYINGLINSKKKGNANIYIIENIKNNKFESIQMLKSVSVNSDFNITNKLKSKNFGLLLKMNGVKDVLITPLILPN